MSNPVNAGDPAEYLATLATIMPAGTPVATVVIQKGLDTEAGAWPALILNCPHTRQKRTVIGPPGVAAYQATFEVHGMYLDRWEVSSRTLEQILADANTALQQMARNVQAQCTLGFDSVIADEDIDVRVDGPVSDPGLGFLMVTGQIVIKVVGPVYRP